MLLVDAFQGVEAQTVANAYAAMEHDLTIVPVMNKIDLDARPRRRSHGRDGADAGDRRRRRARLQRQDGHRRARSCWRPIIERVPPPTGDPNAPLQAMVFDSHYDEFRGAITYVRVMNGTVEEGQKIKFLQAGHDARSARARPVRARSASAATRSAPARSAT